MAYIDPIERTKKHFRKDEMLWVLRDSLDQDLVIQVMSKCGLRPSPEKTYQEHLKELTSEFKKNPKARQLISLYLTQCNRTQIEEIKNTSSSNLGGFLKLRKVDMIDEGELGRYLWGLVVDPREAVDDVLKDFIGSETDPMKELNNLIDELGDLGKTAADLDLETDWADRMRRDLENLAKKMPGKFKPPFPKFPPKSRTGPKKPPKFPNMPKPPVPREKLEKDLYSLRHELKEARESAEKLRARNEQISVKIRAYQDEKKKILTELQEMRREKHLNDKEMTEIKDARTKEIKRLKEADTLAHQVHHLERENKKLHYRVEKLGKLDADREELIADNERMLNQVDQLKKNMNRIEQTLIEKEMELESLQEAIQKKEKKESEKATPLKKAPGKPRVGVFVDVQNIFYGAKEKYDGRMDYQRLFSETLRERTLFKSVCYVVKSPEVKQSGFFSFLEKIGYEVKKRGLKTRMDGSQKGDWDLGIAIDIITQLEKMDIVVLVSGDGDFFDLLKLVHRFKKRVEVFSFPHNTAVELEEEADAYFPIDERFLMIE